MIPNDTTKHIVFENQMFYNIIGKITKLSRSFFHQTFLLKSWERHRQKWRCFFRAVKQEMRLDIMAEPKTIYCPRCGRRVSQHDGRSTINVIANCKKCRKRVVYHVDTGETEVKPIPPRNCSSGMTFY